MTDIIAVDKLRLFIERIERIEADLDARKADRKEVYSELKGEGFDTKATRQIIRLRKKEAHIRQEEDMILETYRTAIGLWQLGEVLKWFTRLVLKTSEDGSPPWVRIPPSPPVGFLAQSVEHLTFNQVVAGSNPAEPTNKGLLPNKHARGHG